MKMKTLLKSTLILGALVGFLGITKAQPCVRYLTPTDDAYTNSTAARSNTNYGTRDRLKSGVWTWQGSRGTEASYLNFDLSEIPANANIVHVSLELFKDPNSNNYTNATQSNAATIRNITGTWNEGSITANNTPSVGSATATIAGSPNRAPSNVAANVTTMVRQMFSTNRLRCGMQITPNSSSTYRMQEWAAKEHTQANVRPRLIVRYTVPIVLSAPTISVTRTCSGGSATINPPQGVSWVKYEWYDNANGINQISSARTINVTGTKQLWGRYSAVGPCGDRSKSPLVAATVTSLPKPNVPQITAANSKLCVGESLPLTANAPNGVWSMVNPNTLHSLSNSGVFTSGDERGIFDVKYTVTNSSGCSNFGVYQVTVGAIDFEIIAPNYVCPNENFGADEIYIQESFEDPATLSNSYHWRISVGDNSSSIQTPTNTPNGIKLYSGSVPSGNFIELSASGKFMCLSGFESTLIKTKKVYYHPYPTRPNITKTETNVSINSIAGYSYNWRYSPFNLQTGNYSTSRQLGAGTSKSLPEDVPGRVYVDYTSSFGCKNSTNEWLPPVDHDHTPCDEALKMAYSFEPVSLEVYPNPTSDFISFVTSGSFGKASVFNTSGNLMSTEDIQEGDFGHSVDVSSLTPGVYVLQVVSDGNVSESTFMVQ